MGKEREREREREREGGEEGEEGEEEDKGVGCQRSRPRDKFLLLELPVGYTLRIPG